MEPVKKAFSKMGARVKIRVLGTGMWERRPFVLDIKTDKDGEYFDLGYNPKEVTEITAVDIRPADRHLLLMVRTPLPTSPRNPTLMDNKEKFLCGHDERHWFAAGVNSTSSSVVNAMEQLKPGAVIERQERRQVKTKKRNKRRNEAFIRQGEWFFMPVDMKIDEKFVLKNEPLRRGAGKPHMAEYVYRTGGTGVYVNSAGQIVTELEYKKLSSIRQAGYQFRRANANVYARGSIKHPDHKTIYLSSWHEVIPNRETSSRNLAFVD